MAYPKAIDEAAGKVRAALARAAEGLVDREGLVELIALAAVAREHVLVVGPPGTAKSAAVRRVSQVLGGRYFEYLLGRFTEPSEIFGPVDLRKLRDGIVETETTGMLPEAEIAFLDEVFRGSTAILNTLLGVLNERRFRRGHTSATVPLRVCVGVTNGLPDDDALEAFADRFLVHTFVEPVSDPRLEELLQGGWQMRDIEGPAVGLEVLDTLADRARAMDVAAVRTPLANAIRALRSQGVELSDRRAVKCQRLVAAAAALAGRAAPTEADLWPIVYAVPTPAGQQIARDALRDRLADAESPTLAAAAEEAARGRAARAARLVESGRALLDAPPSAPDARDAWRLQLEGVAREIDAGFDREDLPEALAAVRTHILDALRGPEVGP